MILFGQKRKNDKLSRIDVSYHQHKPKSNKLVVYNNNHIDIESLQVTIVDNQNHQFFYKYSQLKAKESVLLSLTNLQGDKPASFEGEISRLELRLENTTSIFKPIKTGFVRM
jgi:hypothetical protein